MVALPRVQESPATPVPCRACVLSGLRGTKVQVGSRRCHLIRILAVPPGRCPLPPDFNGARTFDGPAPLRDSGR